MAGAIKTTMGIPPKDIEINLDTLNRIAMHLTLTDVSKLRKASKNVNKIIIEDVSTLKFEALSLKQIMARHHLYKDEHFNKFLNQTFLKENKISGNIYGPENKKKIVVTLLKNINNPDHNKQEKTKFQDFLETYLKECDSLDLSWRSEITDTDLKVIANLCPHLESINLSGCDQITDLSPLSKLNSLNSLNLSFCRQITNLIPLSELNSLQSINLSGCNKITNLIPLSELNSLQSINLSGCNKITNLIPLSELKSLKSLDLSGCKKITNLSPLAGCTNLKSLNLYGCHQITDAGMEALAKLTNLQSINLNGCHQITDAGMEALAKLTNLQSINLSGCKEITNAVVTKLRTTFPALTIQR